MTSKQTVKGVHGPSKAENRCSNEITDTDILRQQRKWKRLMMYVGSYDHRHMIQNNIIFKLQINIS